jgi:hypothetical protein
MSAARRLPEVDDAEDIAVRIGEYDEVRFRRIQVPADLFGTQRDKAFDSASCSAVVSTNRSR